MKSLIVKHIKNISSCSATDVCRILDDNNIEWNKIDNVCWEKDFPYAPDVNFRIAHIGNAVLINYRVKERSIRAVAGSDNGNVWEDSCCEFFFSPSANDFYYNIESNCAGKILFASGNTRHNRKRYPLNFVENIDRWSSNGNGVFDERPVDGEWQMSLVIPVTMFEGLDTFTNLKSTANFYKCGDKLEIPHFLSWNLVKTPTPDYHRPDFFGDLYFE